MVKNRSDERKNNRTLQSLEPETSSSSRLRVRDAPWVIGKNTESGGCDGCYVVQGNPKLKRGVVVEAVLVLAVPLHCCLASSRPCFWDIN